jgi:hypothetical protein
MKTMITIMCLLLLMVGVVATPGMSSTTPITSADMALMIGASACGDFFNGLAAGLAVGAAASLFSVVGSAAAPWLGLGAAGAWAISAICA